MSQNNNNLSEWRDYLRSLLGDLEQYQLDSQLLNTILNNLKNSVTELELILNRMQANSERNVARIKTRLTPETGTPGFRHQHPPAPHETGDVTVEFRDVTALKEAEKKPSIQVSDYWEVKLKSRESTGVVIFISPETGTQKFDSTDSTCIPRRQLLPTIAEEKMILDYLIRTDHKPTQKEYNRLFKEICNMLLNAPKNAIAIEIRSSQPNKKSKFIELFYHIKVKNQLDVACLKYVEIVGVNAYRDKKPKTP